MAGSLDDRATDAADDPVAPSDLRERFAPLERTGGVVGYAPVLDYDELGIRTVIARLVAREGCVDAVAADLRGRNVTDVYVVTGEYNVLAIGRFADRTAADAHLSALATDDRVVSVTATVTLDTVREYDTAGLLADDRLA